MTTLFTLPESKSPRLLWMEKHGVEISHRPEFNGEDEDEFGNVLYPFAALAPRCHERGFGNTQDDALTDWAKKNNVKMWNEE